MLPEALAFGVGALAVCFAIGGVLVGLGNLAAHVEWQRTYGRRPHRRAVARGWRCAQGWGWDVDPDFVWPRSPGTRRMGSHPTESDHIIPAVYEAAVLDMVAREDYAFINGGTASPPWERF